MDDTPTGKGRVCGECMLCCKLLHIAEIQKPAGHWCPHCALGKGCTIYDERPSECRTFYCGYLAWPVMGPHWFPARCKMVVIWDVDLERIAIHVDPGRPAAWREEPFYSEIKAWAVSAAPKMHQIVVEANGRTFAILPDRDIDLGCVGEDELIVTTRTSTAQGPRYEALKLKSDDPRLANRKPGISSVDVFGA